MAAKPLPVLADYPEAVDVAVALLPPIDELDAEFEGGLGALHELDFVELDQLIVFLDRRNGRFTDADDADRFAFNQLDVVEPLEQLPEQRGGHPPGRATANDENLVHVWLRLPAFGWAGHRDRRFREATEARTTGQRQAVAATELVSALLAAGSRPPASRTKACR